MQKIKKIIPYIQNSLPYIQNLLLITLVLLMSFMFYIKHKMSIISTDLIAVDKKIEKLKDDKKILDLELTYLKSSERILNLIEKNPSILADKDIIKSKQLKTRDQFVALSLDKSKNFTYKDSKVARK